jgi:hypothetical protein
MRVTSWLRLTFVGIFTFILFGVCTAPAHAATFNVSRTDDPVPDACNSGVDCSLREAVMAANATLGPDTIVLPAGTYILSIPGAGGAEEGDLDVSESLTVQGAGKTSTVIDADASFDDRIFDVDTGTSDPIDFTVSDLTLQGGETSENGGAVEITGSDAQAFFTNVIVQNNQADFSGGGIYFSSGGSRQFFLKGSDILNNVSDSGTGGGVLCSGSSISCDVEESLFSGNVSASGSGGGMHIGTGGDGSLRHTVVKTVFENNISTVGPGSLVPSGGGLMFSSSKGLLLKESQFLGNIGNGGEGGGVYVSSGGQAVDVENCVFQDNASDGHGGGMRVGLGGTVLVTDSIFDNNESRAGSNGQGGGLYVNNGDDVTVIRSTFTANSADAEGGGGYLHPQGTSGGLVVTDSTFNGNTAVLSGGGAHLHVAQEGVIANSTFSANTTGGEGGGFYYSASMGPAITNSTFSGNTAALSGGGMQLDVGGLSSFNNLTVVQNTSTTGAGGGAEVGFMTVFRNSIFFQNSAAVGNSDDCFGPASGLVTSDGYNIWGPEADNVDCNMVGDLNDLFDVDPMIGALADNGGPTFTHALLAGSPAIDGGNPTGCEDADGNLLTVDQRGMVRPFGVNCDIGAYELQAATPSPSPTPSPEVCNGELPIDGDLGMALGQDLVPGGDTTGGGNDFLSSTCGLLPGEDRAYVWTAPYDATYLFDAIGSSFPVTLVIVQADNPGFPDSDCQGFGPCNFPGKPGGPREPLFILAGTKMVVIVDSSGATGTFVLNIEATERYQGVSLCADSLDNDQDGDIDLDDRDCICNGELPIDGDLGSNLGPAVATGTTVGGGNDFLNSTCGLLPGEDRAFTWTSPADATYLFDAIGSDFPVSLVIVDANNLGFPGSDCQGFGPCNFPGKPGGPREPVFVPAGVMKVIIIDSNGTAGNFVLNIEQVTSEAGFCTDNIDNDFDGPIDCEDTDCDGQSCDSETSCTDGAVCSGGSCTGGTTSECLPLNCFDVGDCVPGQGCIYTPSQDGTSCNDGDACTQGESCMGGLCQSGSPVNCDDNNPCTADSCNTQGGCNHDPLPDFDNDGVCDAIDNCPNVPNSNQANNDGDSFGNACDNCPNVANDDQADGDNDGIGDACDAPACVPAECDDGNFCNGVETCQNDQCVPGTPPICDDGQFCNGTETCNESTDSCDPGTPPVCDDENACNGTEICNEENDSCMPGVPVHCGDGNACNGSETCNPSNGQCEGGTPVDCNDNNVCNGTQTCNPGTGLCEGGMPLSCNDGNACNGTETCHPMNGCQPGTPVNVDDGIACTVDSCTSQGGVTHTPDNSLCPSGQTCSATQGCIAQRCTRNSQCNDGNACNGAEFCHRGTCKAGSPLQCNDGNVCNGAESCNPAMGCVDGTPLDIDDGVDCTDDKCNKYTGEITHEPDNGNCSDGQFCNGREICDPILDCRDGSAVQCPSGQSCNEAQDKCVATGGGGGSHIGVFGFEDIGFWQVIQGSATLIKDTTRKTQGTASLRMSGNNFVVIESDAMNTQDITGEKSPLRMDVFVGGNQPNPYYAGAVQLYAHCPSCGIYNKYISQVELTPLPRNQFVTVSFPLPSSVIQALQGNHADFTWRLSLNANPGAGPYNFDNMRF